MKLSQININIKERKNDSSQLASGKAHFSRRLANLYAAYVLSLDTGSSRFTVCHPAWVPASVNKTTVVLQSIQASDRFQAECVQFGLRGTGDMRYGWVSVGRHTVKKKKHPATSFQKYDYLSEVIGVSYVCPFLSSSCSDFFFFYIYDVQFEIIISELCFGMSISNAWVSVGLF